METINFLAINLSYLYVWDLNDYVAWHFHSDDRLLRAVTSLGQCLTLPYSHGPSLWVTNLCTNICWNSYPKCILAVFWPASAPFKLNRRNPRNSIWVGNPLLTSSMDISWVAFVLCWIWWGCSLIIFSLKFWASSLSFGLPVCKGSQHSFFHNTQIRNWMGKKGTLGVGKNIHGLSVPWVSVALFFSTVLFYFLSQSREFLE